MNLQPGTKLGPYEVREQVGAGGMGEVYLAQDTKLKRDVAIKMLPEQFAQDPDRLARFRREAQVLASLNHPNIAAIYGLEESGSQPCLVMEYVPGETLRDRIVRDGPVPMEEALGIASQICEALEHAHEKSIIHRDLKPANVKLTPEGKVKVLDFGLAKAFAPDASSGQGPYLDSNSPTVAPGASPTLPGVILGTAAYMSPEQAKGKAVDRRSDIWALGCVLYELITGKPAFDGETVTEVLGSVLKAEPDWAALPKGTPPTILTLLRRCLTKDAANRSRDAGELRLQIQDARFASAPSTSTVMGPAPAATRRRWLMLGALACVLVAAIAGMAVWSLRPAASARPVERVTSALPPSMTIVPGNAGLLALSRDGSRLAYVAVGPGSPSELYLRAMDAPEAIRLAGTEAAQDPFFSPDGQWVGFFPAGPGVLKKISVSGGTPLTLCVVSANSRGGAWGLDDTIIFGTQATGGLFKVSAAGGQPEPLTTLLPGETSHRWPQFLPDGKTILFTVGTSGNYDEAQIAVQRLDSREHKIVVRGGTSGRYIPSGQLVYYRAGTLMAVPFDTDTLEVKGSAAPVIEGVLGNPLYGTAQFTFSYSGSLAYLPGSSQFVTQSMVWVNRQGVATPLPAPPRSYRAPRISPDGRQIAVGIGNDVWIYEIARDTLTRLTFEKSNAGTAANWTPDSKRIVFPSDRAGPVNLFWKPVDGSGPEERLTTSSNLQRASSFSPDGRFHVFTEVDPKAASDLWILPMDGDRKPRVFLQTPAAESSGQFSPDGRWIAYVSNESGRPEVYVRPFPGPGGKWQISSEGGTELAWNPKGKELFYRTGAQKEEMMVVDYQTEPTFSAGKPRLLFEGNYVANAPTSGGAFYSVSPDGQRFLMTQVPEQQQSSLTQVNMVLNWFEEVKQKVPVK
jgi:serine/threonine-protein kinase